MNLKDGLQLTRPRLSLMVALSALCGYLAAPGSHSILAVMQLFPGVFLLAAAASAFNQIQERSLDRLLPRTAQRPLASERLQTGHGAWLATPLAIIGTLLLGSLSLATCGVGLLALAWYNLFYTPLKSRTSLVLLVGSIGGALPPLLGWIASGASPLAPKALHLYLVLMIWQVPHFWCLSLRDNLQGQRVGIKLVPSGWSPQRVLFMIRLWTLAFGTLLLAALPLLFLSSPTGKWLVTLLGLGSIGTALMHQNQTGPGQWAKAVGLRLHIILAGILTTIAIDPFIHF